MPYTAEDGLYLFTIMIVVRELLEMVHILCKKEFKLTIGKEHHILTMRFHRQSQDQRIEDPPDGLVPHPFQSHRIGYQCSALAYFHEPIVIYHSNPLLLLFNSLGQNFPTLAAHLVGHRPLLQNYNILPHRLI